MSTSNGSLNIILYCLSIMLISICSCNDSNYEDSTRRADSQNQTTRHPERLEGKISDGGNIVLKADVINLILGSPGMGGGEDFYSFIPRYYSKLSEKEKADLNRILVELIDDDKAWEERIGRTNHPAQLPINESALRLLLWLHYKLTGRASRYDSLLAYPSDRAIFDQKEKAIYICGELNLTEAIPKIEKMLEIRNLNRKYYLFLFHHSIGKFRLRSAVPFLESQVKYFYQPYSDEPAWNEKNTARINAISSLNAFMEIDFERAFPHVAKLLDMKTDYNDQRLDIVIATFKRKYGDQWAEYLYRAAKKNDEKTAQILYSVAGQGTIKKRTAELTKFVDAVDPSTQRTLENIVAGNIDYEISMKRYGSISLCGVMGYKSAIPKLIELTKKVVVTDIQVEPLIVSLGDLEAVEATSFLERYASHFYEEQPVYDPKIPNSGTFSDLTLQNWTKAYLAVISLANIDPAQGLSYIKKCLEVGSEDLIINRLTAIERSFGGILSKKGKEGDMLIRRQLNGKAMEALKKVMMGERVRKLEIPAYGYEMNQSSGGKLANIKQIISM